MFFLIFTRVRVVTRKIGVNNFDTHSKQP